MSEDAVDLTHCIKIGKDGTWSVVVLGEKNNVVCCKVLKSIPPVLGCSSVNQLINLVENCSICCGNKDEKYVHFIAARKGKIVMSFNGSVAAYLDEM